MYSKHLMVLCLLLIAGETFSQANVEPRIDGEQKKSTRIITDKLQKQCRDRMKEFAKTHGGTRALRPQDFGCPVESAARQTQKRDSQQTMPGSLDAVDVPEPASGF